MGHIRSLRWLAPRRLACGRSARWAAAHRGRSSAARQRGWVGLIVLLLALVIVAMLAQTALKRYGLLPTDRSATKTAGPRGVGPTTPVDVDPTDVTPAPADAIERARGVESTLQKQAEDMGKRIDAETR